MNNENSAKIDGVEVSTELLVKKINGFNQVSDKVRNGGKAII